MALDSSGATPPIIAALPESEVDLREQLANDRAIGLLHEIQLPRDEIRLLQGILYDVDVRLLKSGPLTTGLEGGPEVFFNATVVPWLGRHPTLANAEVRDSGRGLHVILWIDPPIELRTAGDRQRWDGIARVVQAALPVDPRQPGITALTRPVGSVNAKADRRVCRLREGRPVPERAVLDLFDSMNDAPFKTLCRVLLGRERVSPCPCCGIESSSLIASKRSGQCVYGSCGKVELADLYSLVLTSETGTEQESSDA